MGLVPPGKVKSLAIETMDVKECAMSSLPKPVHDPSLPVCPHLPTRMVEPRKVLRTWRAWDCRALACRVFPEMPADEEQIAGEGVLV